MERLRRLFKKPEELKGITIEPSNSKDERVFEAFWGEGYSLEMTNGRDTIHVKIDFFTEEKGYRPENIEEINCLEIGEVADLTEMMAVHTVKRIY